jgi:hypothetical protein
VLTIMKLIEDSLEKLVYYREIPAYRFERNTPLSNPHEYSLASLFIALVVIITLAIYPLLPYPANIITAGIACGLCVLPSWSWWRSNRVVEAHSDTLTVDKTRRSLEIHSKYDNAKKEDTVWRANEVLLVACYKMGNQLHIKSASVEILRPEGYFLTPIASFTDDTAAEAMCQRLRSALAVTPRLCFLFENEADKRDEIERLDALGLPHTTINMDAPQLPPEMRGKTAVYRGRKITLERYRHLYEQLALQDIRLINTPDMIEAWTYYRPAVPLQPAEVGCYVYRGQHWFMERIKPGSMIPYSSTKLSDLAATITEGYCFLEFAPDNDGIWYISAIHDAQTYPYETNNSQHEIRFYRLFGTTPD